jgi:hypothetical protein
VSGNDGQWRARLRRRLKAGQPCRVGDLFDEFGANMPLHHATRPWIAAGGTLGDASHFEMRWQALVTALGELSLRFDPPSARKAPCPDTIVTARKPTAAEKRRRAAWRKRDRHRRPNVDRHRPGYMKEYMREYMRKRRRRRDDSPRGVKPD